MHRINTCLKSEVLETLAEEVDQAFLNITQNVAPTLALVDLWRRLGKDEASTRASGLVF